MFWTKTIREMGREVISLLKDALNEICKIGDTV
jgi:hypothetical protein